MSAELLIDGVPLPDDVKIAFAAFERAGGKGEFFAFDVPA